MKLLSYSIGGKTAAGALRDDHVVEVCREGDLLGLLSGGEEAMAAARSALARGREVVSHALAEVRVLPPIRRPGKIVCVGLNYRSHLAEINEPCPRYPILFHKPATSIVGNGDAIVLPQISKEVDFEGELAVVIGKPAKHIVEREALSCVAGYMCANDVSANDVEFRTSQWDSGKMCDTFCPLGPVLVTADELPDPTSIGLRTVVNGRKVQESTTAEMIFPVRFLVSYVSSLATLEPGDVILTGTPAGIGCNQKPPVFLRAGDRVSVQIDGIGTLSNPVVAEEGS
jgi:2-keto-4-pentenoate hydratase/2-oxohepta-3-ene-1,7-dioic acid hydratase in catechol pathway